MPECISIDLILTCSECGCALKGEADVRNAEIVVEPCLGCIEKAASKEGAGSAY